MGNTEPFKFTDKYDWLLLAEYEHWQLFLHENQWPFVGRSYAWAKRDVLSPFDMTAEETSELKIVANDWKKAIENSIGPFHPNIASLGNTDRHLHMHFVPRYQHTPQLFDRSFIDTFPNLNYMATPGIKLEETELTSLIALLALGGKFYNSPNCTLSPYMQTLFHDCKQHDWHETYPNSTLSAVLETQQTVFEDAYLLGLLEYPFINWTQIYQSAQKNEETPQKKGGSLATPLVWMPNIGFIDTPYANREEPEFRGTTPADKKLHKHAMLLTILTAHYPNETISQHMPMYKN